MKGDFSRSTFDPRKHYTSVRMQQGRVQLDADWNEQADILLHLVQTQLADVLGSGAAAPSGQGFAITLDEPQVQPPADRPQGPPPARALPDFCIGAGRCYVDGILCENEAPVRFSQQPDYPAAGSIVKAPADHDCYIVYLDVWSRHVTAVEDPAIREIALGGPDTTTRLKTIWQVRLLPLSGDLDSGGRDLSSLDEWAAFVRQAGQKRRLMARWNPTAAALENRLYRLEIHSVSGDRATFKWSRENGSVVFPITTIDAARLDGTVRVTVEGLDRDPYQLLEGSWVEIADDVMLLDGRTLPLCRVTVLDRAGECAILQAEKDKLDEIQAEIGERNLGRPLLRRWENDGETIVHSQEWLDLENGIQVAFSRSGACQVGDYWLMPARAQSAAGIQWPQEGGGPQAQPPHGVRRRFAPLALLLFQEGGWSVRTQEHGAFQTLPMLTANLSTSEGQLQALYASLEQVQETVGRLVQLTSAFSSLAQLQETVNALAQQSHVFETVRSEDELERGDVVALDRLALEQIGAADQDVELPVRLASSADRGLVVGVVWEALEEQGDGRRYRIVLQGRARCKVLGPVEPGDLLVPSARHGYATKAGWLHRPGTVLGKALGFTTFEPAVMDELEEGTRTVESGMKQQPGAVDALVCVQ